MVNLLATRHTIIAVGPGLRQAIVIFWLAKNILIKCLALERVTVAANFGHNNSKLQKLQRARIPPLTGTFIDVAYFQRFIESKVPEWEARSLGLVRLNMRAHLTPFCCVPYAQSR